MKSKDLSLQMEKENFTRDKNKLNLLLRTMKLSTLLFFYVFILDLLFSW